MEFLMQISELWNEFLIGGLISCALAFLFLGIAMVLAKLKKNISATMTALIAFFCGDIFRITTLISLILFLLKIVLTFI